MDDDEKVVLSKEEHERLTKELEEIKQEKSNIVEEIKSLRSEKSQEAEARKALEEKLEKLNKKEDEVTDELTPEKIQEMASAKVLEILQKDQEDKRKATREDIERKFKEIHKEFHPDNDEGGLKYAAFERYLKRFNLDAMENPEDLQSVYEDAYKLMGGSSVSSNNEQPPVDVDPTDGNTPPAADPNLLTPEEKKMVKETFGGDTDRYLKLKAKDPDYFENLTRYVK